MQRIIEEKRRQRTVSIGSLDGMVITRDNELIAAPLVADRPPLLTAASITRISEAVMRKMEARLAGCQESGGGGGGVCGGGETPKVIHPGEFLACYWGESGTIFRSKLFIRYSGGRFGTGVDCILNHCQNCRHSTPNLSRLNLVRESLPHLIQGYVQSQASIAVQNYIAKQHHQLLAQSGATPTSIVASGAATVAATAGTANPGFDATAYLANSRMRSISNANSICPTAGSNTPQTQKARALSSLLQSRELTVATVEVPSPVPLRRFFVPSSACASECLSLRRTISDASITSSNRGIQVPLEIQQEVAELLDGEVRTEVQHRLRREMMRPQYKKDLFFTGSALQLNHTPVPAIPLGDANNVWATRDQSNWDIGPTSITTHNPPATPNATISTRGFCPETDSTTTAVGLANVAAVAATVEPKYSITSVTSSVQQQHHNHPSQQLLQKVSQTGSKCAGDTMRVAMDYDDDGEDVISIGLPTGRRPCCSNPILTFLEELLAPGLLLSPTFICLLLSNIFTMWGLITPYFMLPDLVAANNWTPHEAGSLISYIGFANTIGRCIATLYIEKVHPCFCIVTAWLRPPAWSSHYKWADCLRVNVASLLLAAVACELASLMGRSYNLLICAGCLFGLFSAVVVSLKSILVVELFGLDKLTNAFGHMLVLQGVASIVGTLIGGTFAQQQQQQQQQQRELKDGSSQLFDTFASGVPTFVPWAHRGPGPVYAAETSFHFASCSFLLAALFASPLRCLARREVISATYTTTGPGVVGAGGGGVYVDDYFEYGEGGAAGGGGGGGGEDGSVIVGAAAFLPAPPPVTEPGTGNTSESAVNLIQSPAPPQLPPPQSPPTSLQPPFDSGIPNYAGEMVVAPVGVTATVMEAVEPPLPPPPPPQSSIPDPATILSPAPLPSSLFITSTEAETQPQIQASVDVGGADIDSTPGGGVIEIGGSAVVDVLTEEDRSEVITTAGVPMGNLTSRSTIQPQSSQGQTTPETGLVWSTPSGAPIVPAVPASTVAEVKTSLVAEEPALEPVKEEEEEEEMEEQPRVPLSSPLQPPPSLNADDPPSATKRDLET
ncbi:unnamed protein product [Hydatigera taeniaeformis]|uniref:Uncharacterized protein n=1 Tax=Hydatigena taeniaeformis TaxID=6205 RepID=A0A0R3X4N5_HYDTA|nr:unnamed protein product [Hydatigera taeniaeformis]